MKYKNELYDLIFAILRDTHETEIAFSDIQRLITRDARANPYEKYEKALHFRIAIQELESIAKTRAPRLDANEQIKMDRLPSSQERLSHFEDFFRRLPCRNQILLLLKDRFQFSDPDLEAIFGEPIHTLRLRRTQALQSLEEWIWPKTP